eukprot:SM000072S21201  [mRNA]  locus=s72:269152:269547:- [translate_table: standard]
MRHCSASPPPSTRRSIAPGRSKPDGSRGLGCSSGHWGRHCLELLSSGRLRGAGLGGAQGFPVDWIAAAGDDGRGGSTSSAPEEGGGGLAARFAMVGNAVSVPVVQSLGERLADPAGACTRLCAAHLLRPLG